ncbi:MAG: hypothetical protein IT535_06275 [Bauldia sp.]|nr:hypothetical protein [Bauldia sp.]
MNTANLQLTGLYSALVALLKLIREKDLVGRDELDAALEAAERQTVEDTRRAPELSDSNVDAICFPIRYLRAANDLLETGQLSFIELTSHVARTKPDALVR